MMKRFYLLAAMLLAGCGIGRDEIERAVSRQIHAKDMIIKEARTLAGLAKLESSISDYVKSEGKIPRKIVLMIPNYLADVPIVEIAVRGHRDTGKVEYYPSSVIRGGKIDGSRIKDTGRWGYAFNDGRVIIFVDCTHRTSKGDPWFRVRGVF